MASLESSSSADQLNCSLCEKEFTDVGKWVKHLAKVGHQTLARQQFNSAELLPRKSTLVIFTTINLNAKSARNVVQYFYKDQGSVKLIENFVWWEERPRVLFIQFRNSKRAKKAATRIEQTLKANGNEDGLVQVENGLGFEVKRGQHLLDLEWKCLFPENNPAQ